MKSFSDFFSGLKTIRGLPYIIIAAAAGVLLIIWGGYAGKSAPDRAAFETAAESGCLDYEKYARELEERVKTLLTGIRGAEGASVMITLKYGGERVYARNEDGIGGKNYVIIDGDPDTGLLVKQVFPKVAGAAVVTRGVDAQTKLEIISMLSALLDLPSTNIFVR